LLLLEHSPVITIGAAGGEESLLATTEQLESAGVALVHTDRGGNITYHGPGQLVGYPIFDLRSHGKDVHRFIRNLEQVVIGCLEDFGVKGEAVPKLTGVWVGEEKICSIGIAVRRWISYHGLALNVSPNFEHWSLINPCGLVGRQVTSLERLIGHNPGMDAVKRSIVDKFVEVFEAR
jgi:lipoate-protein ligase B